MIYFRKNDEVIEKYQIDFDKEELNKIKNMIIDNCSHIVHEDYESDYSPNFTNNQIIKNKKYVSTGKRKEYFEETRPIFRYSYDEYIPPYLVELINQLLNDNPNAINSILEYDLSTASDIDNRIKKVQQELIQIDSNNNMKKSKLKELEKLLDENTINSILEYDPSTTSDVDNRIKKVQQELIQIDSNNNKMKKSKLKELEKLLDEKELNKNQQSIEPYYNQLLGLISFNLIDSILISELARIESFLEIELVNNVISNDSKEKISEKSLKKIN